MDGVHIKSNFTNENNVSGEDETNNSIENASDERVMMLDNMELCHLAHVWSLTLMMRPTHFIKIVLKKRDLVLMISF